MIDPSVLMLADEYWEFHRGSAQFWNIDRGDVDHIESWEDFSPTGIHERLSRLDGFAVRAESIAEEKLDDQSRTLLSSVAFSARAVAATLPYERNFSMVAGTFNFAMFMTVLVPGYGLTTHEQAHGYIAKLRSLPSFIDGWVDGLREGAADGRSPTARGVMGAIAGLDSMLRTDPADDPLTRQVPASEMSEPDISQWRDDIVDAVRRCVRPALARLAAVLRDEILPDARQDDRAGICHLPEAGDDYQALLHAATSTDLSAQQVHDLGRQQLALIDDEYRVLGAKVFGLDDPGDVRSRMHDDPLLRYTDRNDVIAAAEAALVRAQEAAPLWFTRLPSAGCSTVAVDQGPLAYYTAPSPDGTRGGTCFFNTSVPGAWTRFNLEATMFHESVPGHHLQLALAQELDLHPVIGELEVSSYGEGWGLYAERLADEMGLYSGPLQRLGMLGLDSLRAARLVVDTGLHAMGWTRAEAIAFLTANTPLAAGNVEAEIDRYIATPGQATSYMIGRLEIQRLRTHAQTRLPNFALNDFHAIVLGNGMVPLTELSRSIDTWIDASLGPNPPLRTD